MLTEEQKNYIKMLSLGTVLPENQLREMLTRSGWNKTQVDYGVLFNATSAPTKPNPIEATPSSIVINKSSQLREDIANELLKRPLPATSSSEKMQGLVTPPGPIVFESKHTFLNIIIGILSLAIVLAIGGIVWYMFITGFGPFAVFQARS